uniref:Hexosyltransferase n=1 Tax=Timema cristinae TaxID=61476 RepID=A0A7R9H4G5_TIMCR|nr:unnamed protein product [Timema cristinae]
MGLITPFIVSPAHSNAIPVQFVSTYGAYADKTHEELCGSSSRHKKDDNCQMKIIVWKLSRSSARHNLDQPLYSLIQSELMTYCMLLIGSYVRSIYPESGPTNIKQRETIRDTWLKLIENVDSIKHYFVIGSSNLSRETFVSIKQEQHFNNDLVVLPNVVDAYHNLSKKILETFVWLDNSNFTYNFVLKCDDDSFIQIKDLFTELKHYHIQNKLHKLYWGFFNGRAQVKKRGKWKEYNWILCDYYLPYALGGGYVLSEPLVNFIATNAHQLRLFQSEDVSVGVWLASVSGIERRHDPRFDTEYISRGCSNSYLVTHKHNTEDMVQLFRTIQSKGLLCLEEYKKRYSYIYNWEAPPSQCCIRNNASIP